MLGLCHLSKLLSTCVLQRVVFLEIEIVSLSPTPIGACYYLIFFEEWWEENSLGVNPTFDQTLLLTISLCILIYSPKWSLSLKKKNDSNISTYKYTTFCCGLLGTWPHGQSVKSWIQLPKLWCTMLGICSSLYLLSWNSSSASSWLMDSRSNGASSKASLIISALRTRSSLGLGAQESTPNSTSYTKLPDLTVNKILLKFIDTDGQIVSKVDYISW